MSENMYVTQQSSLVCAFKLNSPRPPSPLASISVAVLVMVLVGATVDVLNTMPSIANTVQIQIPTNLGNSAQLVKDTINMATSLMTALSFQMLVRMVNVKTICQDSLAFAMKVTPLMKLELSALTSMSAKRIHVSHHPNVETLMVVMNASVHLVSSKKMASAWMSTNARQKRTNANIFVLIPLVPILANVQKDSSNIEILVSTVMSALNRSIFVALGVFVLTMLVHSIANVNAVTV